jgi:hypothetical protein
VGNVSRVFTGSMDCKIYTYGRANTYVPAGVFGGEAGRYVVICNLQLL